MVRHYNEFDCAASRLYAPSETYVVRLWKFARMPLDQDVYGHVMQAKGPAPIRHVQILKLGPNVAPSIFARAGSN